MAKAPTGIRPRHARSCPAAADKAASCRCRPAWEASVYSARDGRKLRKTFQTLAEAKAWRHDAASAVRKGELRAKTNTTLRQATGELLAGMKDGTVRGKGGRPYKPSALVSYEAALMRHVLPDLGALRLADVTPVDAQALVDRLVAADLSGQTVRNVVTAASIVYRFARRRGWATVNPFRDLDLPAGAKRRERVVDPREARQLLDALPSDLRALYGLAVYAGLRRGEIAGLRWRDVRFDDGATSGTIAVERSYCWRAMAFGEPKTERARRTIPMVGPLAELLLAWSVEHPGGELLFPSVREKSRPFDPRAVARRADTAWKHAQLLDRRIVLHEGRHSAASAFIASGIDPVRVSGWIGHSQTSTTTDVYAKAFAARERADTEKVAEFFAAFTESATGAHTGAQER